MKHLRINKDRAQSAKVLLWLMIIILSLQIGSGLLQYNLLQDFNAGNMPTDAEVEANDLREQILSIIYLVMILISAVTFISWFRRAYYNIIQIYPNKFTYTEGWAAGAWFTPILNLFAPVKIMKEMHTETANYFKQRGEDLVEPFNYNLINAWWAFWIIGSILGRITSRLIDDAYNTVEQLTTYTLLEVVTASIMVVGAFLAVKVVSNYAANEDKLRALVAQEIKEEKEKSAVTEAE